MTVHQETPSGVGTRPASEHRGPPEKSRDARASHPFDELIATVARQQFASKKTTRGIIEAFIAALGEAVWERGRLVVPGLGAFNVRRRVARNVRHPETAEAVRLPAREVVTCRVSKHWRTR